MISELIMMAFATNHLCNSTLIIRVSIGMELTSTSTPRTFANIPRYFFFSCSAVVFFFFLYAAIFGLSNKHWYIHFLHCSTQCASVQHELTWRIKKERKRKNCNGFQLFSLIPNIIYLYVFDSAASAFLLISWTEANPVFLLPPSTHTHTHTQTHSLAIVVYLQNLLIKFGRSNVGKAVRHLVAYSFPSVPAPSLILIFLSYRSVCFNRLIIHTPNSIINVGFAKIKGNQKKMSQLN